MEKITAFKKIVRDLMTEYFIPPQQLPEGGEQYLVQDDIRNEFLIFNNYWTERGRIYGCLLHIQIKNDKIYVQYNGTDTDIAADLMSQGVSNQEIVLAFQHPAKRRHTPFALA